MIDNLPAYKADCLREAIEGAKASLLYLPASSPDFNPIEMTFSTLKALLRVAAPRTTPKLWQSIAEAIDRMPSLFDAAGYDAV